jgi:hydroxypyruvate isomerase
VAGHGRLAEALTRDLETASLPRFSANLEFLFQELPFLERFDAAGASGFTTVEYMFPYAQDVGLVARTLQTNNLRLDLFNLPAGDFAAGERGIAVDPSRVDEFARGVDDAVRIAGELGCSKINCLVGRSLPDHDFDQQYHCLVDNLRLAQDRLATEQLSLQVELLTPIETPGFFLDNLDLVERLLADVPGLRFQCDLYHVQRTRGDLIGTLRRFAPSIGHVQIADAPERHEPGTGEINYRRVLQEIDAIGYSGRIGLEYKPSGATTHSFDWVSAYGYDVS